MIKCSHTRVIPIEELVPNPRNPNTHPKSQIELLAKILKTQGFRQAIVVSKRSGFIVKGHGRLEAAKLAGLHQVPIDEQDYSTEAEEWSDMIADNRIAELAELDNAMLKDLIQELDTGENDLDLTAYDTASLEMLMSQFHVGDIAENPETEWEAMPEYEGLDPAYRKVTVAFDEEKDVVEFFNLINQSYTEKTKSIWFPKKENRDLKSQVWQNNE
jgi:hypothetical protein